MFCSVVHRIDNPEKFWREGEALVASLPAGFEVLSTLPNEDGTRAVCLWQCPSVEELKDLIESKVGTISRNDYIEVDETKARGLPKAGGVADTARAPSPSGGSQQLPR